ncbi:MAG: hypothetical protein CMJ89_20335 [Planctomycetes bacterium]|nr:hypothetical protein [Planctomycetota bacterium]
MGHRLVAVAFTFVGAYNEKARAEGTRQLEPLEIALLTLMAHSARDGDRPTYFAGRDATCDALGLERSEPARRRVMRATSALVKAGAIERVGKGHRGSTARYSLIYQGGDLVVPIPAGVPNGTGEPESVPREHPQSGGNGYHQRTEWVPPAHGMGTTSAPPYRNTRKDSRARPRTHARGPHICRFDPVSGYCEDGCGKRDDGHSAEGTQKLSTLHPIGRTA